MNKFEIYNASEITPQHTLLKKLLALIDYLKKNPTYNIFASSANYSSSITTYQISTLDLRGFEILIGDAILFANGKIGFIESVGETTFTILNGIDIRGPKGDTGEKGEKGDTGEIEDVHDLIDFFIGSETIVVDLSEDNEHIEIHLDAEILSKIENALQIPLSHTELKIVAISEEGSQSMLKIGTGLAVEEGFLKSLHKKLYKHTIIGTMSYQGSKTFKGQFISLSDTELTSYNYTSQLSNILGFCASVGSFSGSYPLISLLNGGSSLVGIGVYGKSTDTSYGALICNSFSVQSDTVVEL